MSNQKPSPRPVEQGRGGERLPLPPLDALDAEQRAAAQVLIDGPRKAVYGPFVPLLRTPVLLDRVAQLGEALRFGGRLDARVRELVICVAARAVGNQFEWVMHQPLARAAGIDAGALEAIRVGARAEGLMADEQAAVDFATELLQHDGVADASYARALAAFGEPGVVELATLIGYFVMVSWVMNVARTPSRPTADVAPLPAWPL
ncbi:carboxymuconolactone decarboxylase family protein [Aquincola sp. S2]|uniref:Carboxymuconolactone decarboxylase family protein n=1 Tax=Pseudaquabacterium terrae TaxID=2732868 RepID=A0ABX2EK99_9BURK|nr:carboxymuconolactone decarboxylase family protein [Aquabacterium terrae]NRF68964.1 carboxymuconolactone decarboxylase family protein [Aquabacterium terrae]